MKKENVLCVSEVFRVFKGAMTTAAIKVVQYRALRSKKKRSAW